MEATPASKSDIPQGTLDLLIMQIAALGPIHGYAVARDSSKYRKRFYKCNRALSIRRCTD